MPEASKNVAIGVLVALALGLILWVLLFLHPSFGDGALKLHVRFADIEKISVGTRVTYAGRPIGEVKEISFVPDDERTTSQFPDEIYTYDLTLAIDSHIPIFTSDEITIGTSGLMGERFISIIPKRNKNNTPTLLTSNQVVYSEKPPSVEDTFSQISTLAAKADETIDALTNLVKDNRDEVEASLQSLKSASAELNTLLKTTNKSELVTTLSKAASQLDRTMAVAEETIVKINNADLVAKVHSTMQHLDSIASSLDQPETINSILASAKKLSVQADELSNQLSTSWPKVTAAIDNVSSAAESAKLTLGAAQITFNTLQTVVNNMSSGQGSMGKLLVSDDFYFKTMAVMNKADLMMNDVNHYGVLYHLDKGWQRDRRKRIEELARLQNPQEFKTYLNEEMFKITTSISRVGMALEKAENVASGTGPSNAEFGHTFNDLLAQIQDLQASLKNYSIEIAERQALPPANNQPSEQIASEN